jgi:hypothetical protein
MSKRFHKEEYRLVISSSKYKIAQLVKIFDTLKLPFKTIKRKKSDLLEINIKKSLDSIVIKHAICKAKISKTSCSIIVNLISNSDMDGLTLPRHIAEFYKSFGGNLSILIKLSMVI